jgi:hypothetical protein
MKKIFIALFLSIPFFSFSQVVDGLDIGKMETIDYLEILGTDLGVFKKKIIIQVDYGQKFKLGETDMTVEGEDGKAIIFNSMMDAVNRFNNWGWELQFAYNVSNGQGGAIYHYVFKRKEKK